MRNPQTLASLGGWGLGFGGLTICGAAVPETMSGTATGFGPGAGEKKPPATANISGSPNPATLTLRFIPRRPWQSAVILEIARPGASWAAAGPAFCHSLPKKIPDPPECAAIPGSGGPAWAAWPPPPQPRRRLPA